MTGIYAHIPFCVSKCFYCDFLSFAPEGDPENIYSEYTDALINEISHARNGALYNEETDTVFIGGGTPTALPAPFLFEILNELRKFKLTRGAEFTVEANPGTLNGETIGVLKSCGVNRISVGLQAWDDDLLARIGRKHTREDFIDNFYRLRDARFENINVDLIFGLPGQTETDWNETLSNIIELNPEHVSAYSLSLGAGSKLSEDDLPPEETDRKMYRKCCAALAKAGYKRYELSNFARPGFECKHNVRYWKRLPYFGFGLGASSYFGGERWKNTEDKKKYIGSRGICEREEIVKISRNESMSETMILGLRISDGVSLGDFKNEFGVPLDYVFGEEIKKLTGEGLLRKADGRVFLTKRGLDLANRVFVCFV